MSWIRRKKNTMKKKVLLKMNIHRIRKPNLCWIHFVSSPNQLRLLSNFFGASVRISFPARLTADWFIQDVRLDPRHPQHFNLWDDS